jgi:hypothetical protein
LNGYSCIRIAEGGEWKTANHMGYGLLEHLGCHLSSEGIAMSPAKIQSIENWAELRISPAKIQPIEDWAAPRSVENFQQFLGFAEKSQERSAVLGTHGLLLEGFCNSCQGNLVGVLARLCPLLPAGRGGWILQTSTLVRGTSNGVEGGTPV